MAKKNIIVQGKVKSTQANNEKHYNMGMESGKRHGINTTSFISDALWDENRVKAEGWANYDEPFQSYWKGYSDGMALKGIELN